LLTKRTFVGLDPKKKVNNDNDDEEEGGGEHPLQAAEGRRGRAAAYDSVDINK
jgi:hypothetical protein